MIRFDRVSKVWADGSQAISDVSLEIPKGQFCVILGPSGAGKSSLLRTVNGLLLPSSGQVLMDAVAMNKHTQQTIRKRVAMIHQHFNLSPRLSVATNVLAGALPAVGMWRALAGWFDPQDRQRACELIEGVGLSPEHLQRRAGDLSGGQQQRVGIARAFMLNPEVVLADEPVASLDPKISADILGLIKRTAYAHGTTVLCSLHQVDLARQFADRIVGMREGQIVFDGHPDAFTNEEARNLYHGCSIEVPLMPNLSEPEIKGLNYV